MTLRKSWDSKEALYLNLAKSVRYCTNLPAIEQYENKEKAGSYNIGPEEKDCIATGELVSIFCREWTEQSGNQIVWIDCYDCQSVWQIV